jgi:hypothetical protein
MVRKFFFFLSVFLGDVYKGNWKGGMLCGYGEEFLGNGDVFRGRFVGS